MSEWRKRNKMVLNVYKDSNGNFLCSICHSSYTSLQDAMDCVKKHGLEKSLNAVDENNLPPVPINNKDIVDYKEDVKNGGTLQAAERLMLSLIEDYVVSRDRDLREKGRIGAITMNMGKIAAEAMNTYNKIAHGTKSASINMSLDSSKKSDIDAMKELLMSKKSENEPS